MNIDADTLAAGRRVLTWVEGCADRDRAARLVWSALAEPGDAAAAHLVAEIGAADALEALVTRPESALDRFRPRLQRVDPTRMIEDARGCGAHLLIPTDAEWPGGVNDLNAPPLCLWVRGDRDLAGATARSIAIVGARASTAYGESVAADLAAGLAERRITVVSGGAFGIDAAAHRGVLAVEGHTIAVLAGGVDRPYPVAHHRLLGHIAQTGAVVSELPPGASSLKSRFLLRNRLIATMTTGTLVVEAGRRSGSRNTAGTASAHHRIVMAVPGAITSAASVGCHEMIRAGMAQLVTDVDEILELIGGMGEHLCPDKASPSRAGDGLEGADRRVFDVLGRAPQHADDLCVAAGESLMATRAALGRLDLLGLARHDERGWRSA
ncbi:MAG: DNA-processing protein DprA [Mobilicoccus sp.]|nr:DNA-processing protein DprA [Mobilicoccus sp.]